MPKTWIVLYLNFYVKYELARQQTWSNYKKYKKDEKANNNITKPKLSKIMVQESLRESNRQK